MSAVNTKSKHHVCGRFSPLEKPPVDVSGVAVCHFAGNTKDYKRIDESRLAIGKLELRAKKKRTCFR